MNKAMLITRPGHDLATLYLLEWSKQLVKLAQDKRIDTYDLLREKANQKELIGRVTKMRPSLIVLNGHGNQDNVFGHDNKVLISANNAAALGFFYRAILLLGNPKYYALEDIQKRIQKFKSGEAEPKTKPSPYRYY